MLVYFARLWNIDYTGATRYNDCCFHCCAFWDEQMRLVQEQDNF